MGVDVGVQASAVTHRRVISRIAQDAAGVEIQAVCDEGVSTLVTDADQGDDGGGQAPARKVGDLHVSALARRLRAEFAEGWAAARLPSPRLVVEPGRAVAGPAGIALYRVLAVKHTGGKVFAAVDGSMSDNPRPALYGALYAPRLVGRRSTAGARAVTVVGRHCKAGGLLAVPVACAYHLSMASGYNLVGRPAVVAVHDGTARVLLRRETLDDLRSRDIGK